MTIFARFAGLKIAALLLSVAAAVGLGIWLAWRFELRLDHYDGCGTGCQQP